MIVVILLSMKASQSNPFNIRRLKITATLIGNQSQWMLVQVRVLHAFCHLPFWSYAIEFRTNKPSDIISTLVSIYDSRDLFVKELQVLLAQRLLAVNDGIDRVEKEVCTGPEKLSSPLVS